MTSLTPKDQRKKFTGANCADLNVLGSVRVNLKLGGVAHPTAFQVIEDLSQDVILGVEFLQRYGAVIDYNRKRCHCITAVSLYHC